MDMNGGLEADGSNISVQVQKHIYQKLTMRRVVELLPGFNPRGEAAASDTTRGASGAGTSCSSSTPGIAEAEAITVEDHSLLVKGWAAIPRGGLERQDMVIAMAGPRHCIMSESSSAFNQPQPSLAQRPKADDEGSGEAVWLSLRFSFLLFLSASPSDPAPYAYVRLQDAVLRDINHQTRQIVLVGSINGSVNRQGAVHEGEDVEKYVLARPLGNGAAPLNDPARLPLPLCFLLADGRFQPFEAQFLELRFHTDEDLDMWARELGMACGWRQHGVNTKAETSKPKRLSEGGALLHPQPDISINDVPDAGPLAPDVAEAPGSGSSANCAAETSCSTHSAEAGSTSRKSNRQTQPAPSAPPLSPPMVHSDGPVSRSANPPRPAG